MGTSTGIVMVESLSQLYAFVLAAAPGERCCYHRGFLSIDRSPTGSLGRVYGNARERRMLSELADAVCNFVNTKLLRLVQQRNGVDDYSYLAERSSVRAVAV